jgi:hypothetical protein
MAETRYQDLYARDSCATRCGSEKDFYLPDDRTFHQAGYFYDSDHYDTLPICSSLTLRWRRHV